MTVPLPTPAVSPAPVEPTGHTPLLPEPGYRFYKHAAHPEVFVRTPNGLIRQVLAAEYASYGLTDAVPWPITGEADYVNFINYAKALGFQG